MADAVSMVDILDSMFKGMASNLTGSYNCVTPSRNADRRFPKLRGILGEGGKGKSNCSALTSCTSKLKTPVFHTRVSGVFIALTALSLEQALPLFPTCLKITEDYCSLKSASIYLF